MKSIAHWTISLSLSAAALTLPLFSTFTPIECDILSYKLHKIEEAANSSEQKEGSKPLDAFKELEQLLPHSLWPESLKCALYETTHALRQLHTKLLADGEAHYAATLYSSAIPSYAALVDAISSNNHGYDSAEADAILFLSLCRLGQSHFFANDYAAARFWLKQKRPPREHLPHHLLALEGQSIYIYALACRYLGYYSEAIELLQNYDKCDALLFSALLPEACCELGLNYFYNRDLSKARQHLSQLSRQKLPLQLFSLAQLYLARILLYEGNPDAAEEKLALLAKTLPSNHEVHCELAFLRGAAALQAGHYEKATNYFALALPPQNWHHAPWHLDTLYHLASCFMQSVKETSQTKEKREQLLANAEEALLSILEHAPEEHLYLALAQCHLLRGKFIPGSDGFIRAEKLLTTEEIFKTLESRAFALLLRADATSSYQLKEQIYKQLTDKEYINSIFYAEGWYCRGLNAFNEAQRLSQTDHEKSMRRYQKACKEFHLAFRLLKDKDPKRSASALRYSIFSHYYLGSEEHLITAIKILDQVNNEKNSPIQERPQSEELTYLYGAIACKLWTTNTHDCNTFALAERTLWNLIHATPQSPFADKSLQLLGNLYLHAGDFESAEKSYSALITDYPSSPYVDHGLFWGSHCAEKLKRDQADIRAWRKRLYDDFPQSPLAASAYYTYYSLREYLQGGKEAIKHLQAFKKKFPLSPLVLNCYYLLGLDSKRERRNQNGHALRKKDLYAALDSFQHVETLFSHFYGQKAIPTDELSYYINLRYRALLECALANQAIATCSKGTKKAIYEQYAEAIFATLNSELSDATHPYARHLINESPFPRIQEESLYFQLIFQIECKKPQRAKKSIEALLKKYCSNQISQGYYLSRIFFEEGMMKMRDGDYEAAWQALMKAEQSAKGSLLTNEERLDLWIQQSICYRELEQIDKAMLILSKVINDQSISSLRLKAMLLRAELYAQQGRHELARKQLEAVAQKGGEWGATAKMKLVQNYGY